MFASGLSAGICNIFSGVSVGIAGSSAALGDAQASRRHVSLRVVVFVTLALFGRTRACLFD